MVDRIKQVMEYYEETPAEFAEKIGVNRSNLTHVFTGRNQPSLDFAKKVLVAFPEISTEWLIMGVGNMIKDPDDAPVVKREFIQTDLFDSMDEGETVEPVPEPEHEPEIDEKLITNGTEKDILEPSDEIPMENVKSDEDKFSPSKEVEELETEDVKPVEQPVVTVPESNIPKRAVHQSGKSNSRTVEKTAAKPVSSYSNPQPMEKPTSPVERPQSRPAVRPMEKTVVTPVERPGTVSVERPVAARTEQAPVSREKKIEKIIFFYNDDSFKVYHP